MKRSELADVLETLPEELRFNHPFVVAAAEAAAIIRSTVPQPMEAAPREGTHVLLHVAVSDENMMDGLWIECWWDTDVEKWDSGGLADYADDGMFDLWLPLPEVEG